MSLGIREPTLKYHPLFIWSLILKGRPDTQENRSWDGRGYCAGGGEEARHEAAAACEHSLRMRMGSGVTSSRTCSHDVNGVMSHGALAAIDMMLEWSIDSARGTGSGIFVGSRGGV